uniref:ankyrin repeat domain-containing protein n=1 Tax=Cerasicoccus frondis TaxID=490090 RepID=UPI0028528838
LCKKETDNLSELTRELNRAIEGKNLEETLSILSRNPDLLDIEKSGISVMHWACDCDFSQLIPELVKRGCSPNALDENGYPPIYYPSSEGFVSVIRTLLEYGADIEGLREIEESGYIEQTTPLVRATRNGHLEVVQLLISKGATTKVKDTKNSILDHAGRHPEVRQFLEKTIKNETSSEA